MKAREKELEIVSRGKNTFEILKLPRFGRDPRTSRGLYVKVLKLIRACRQLRARRARTFAYSVLRQ